MLLRRRPRPVPEDPWQEVSTLVLAPALEELAWRPTPRVLDLGPAVAANVELFAQENAQVHVADLHATLLDQEISPATNTTVWERALPPREKPFDLILAWDLLNYLQPEAITALARALARLSHPETLLAAWIAIRDPLPVRPGRYAIMDRNTLRYTPDPSSSATRPSPRYREMQLVRWLEGFTVHKAFLMRHGVQEYLFAFQAP
jgi:hypothetical protein